MSGPKLSLPTPLGRRNFLANVGSGMGLLALRAIADEQPSNPLAPIKPAFKPKAKRLIHLFMNGGPSQIDSFDPKPLLAKYAGKPIPGPKLLTERPTGSGFPSPFKFLPRGQSGPSNKRTLSKCRPVRRHALRRSLHANRYPQPRTGAHADELRRPKANSPKPRLLACPRPRHRMRQPARLRLPLPRWPTSPRRPKLAKRLLARRLPRHPPRHPRRFTHPMDRKFIQPSGFSKNPAGPTRTSSQVAGSQHRQPAARRKARGPLGQHGTGLPYAMGS
jgi:hypothetical protein